MNPMENTSQLGYSSRGFSREGVKRAPSRGAQGQGTPDLSRKSMTKTGLSVSGQNFFNVSQVDTQSSADDLMLGSVNIAVDETAFISTTKADLIQLQDEINKMDIDGKIRSTNPSNILKKNHVYAMAKFLQRFNNPNIKGTIEKRVTHASNFDTEDLLKFMNVRSESEGLRKLFKMMGMLDLMLLKVTEIHAVTFLKYDQIFENLRKQFGGQVSNKVVNMESGINVSRFHVDLANLDRIVELYSYISKLSQQNKASGLESVRLDKQSSKGSDSLTKVDGNEALRDIQSIEELYTSLRNGEKLGFNNNLVSSIVELVEGNLESKSRESSLEKRIKALEKELDSRPAGGKGGDNEKELQKKIDQLTKDAESLRKELDQNYGKEMSKRETELKEKTRKLEYQLELKDDDIKKLRAELDQAQKGDWSITKPPGAGGATKEDVFNSEYYIKLVKQIEDNYNAKSKDVEEDNHKKDKELTALKIRLEATEREKEDLAARLAKLEAQEERDARLRLKGDDQSFELALREQFNAMKEGFENKIKGLSTELQTMKKEKSLEVLEVRKELQREKENRELLLRKLQIYTKN